MGLSGSLVGPASAKTTVERSAQLAGPSPIPVHTTGTGPIFPGVAQGTQAPRPVTTSFEIYKRSLGLRAIRDGVGEATVTSLLPGLLLNQRAMELDYASDRLGRVRAARRRFPYLREHVSPSSSPAAVPILQSMAEACRSTTLWLSIRQSPWQLRQGNQLRQVLRQF